MSADETPASPSLRVRLQGALGRELPAESRPLRIAILAYLGHLICEGWIGSSQFFLGVAIIAAGVAVWKGELRVPFHPLYLPLALFVAASFLSALASFRPLYSLWDAREWFAFLTLPLALSLYARSPGVTRLATSAFIVLALMQSLVAMIQYFLLGHDALEQRITGTTSHVMTFSGIVLPLSLIFVSFTISRPRRLFAIGAAATMLALALSFTRGAWIGWFAGLAFLVLLRRPRITFLLIPLLLWALILSPLPLFARLVSSFDFKQTSVLDRIRMIEAGREMIRDHPLLGVGPGNVKEVYPLYRRPDAPRFRIPHLHNNLVQLWAERGLLALGSYLALLTVFLRSAWLRRREGGSARIWAEGGIAATIGLFVAGLFEFNFGDTEVLLTRLDLWALALSAGSPEKGPAVAGIGAVPPPANRSAVEAVPV
ncbi:MAG TPA: O-antigen ligase family protein [Thermoanaerobaculia bacterium]|nr:O-antigen ligase family protein [Thermoanaerobaculia bacterium]